MGPVPDGAMVGPARRLRPDRSSGPSAVPARAASRAAVRWPPAPESDLASGCDRDQAPRPIPTPLRDIEGPMAETLERNRAAGNPLPG